ncbi:TonB-dependent receptor domain-containing protein [Flavobacterium sp. N3904]|uniref:TonB-dependent receptor domain-containing protein n=1 Tax=Flavobacterium sp. N3904 TaxID=2986835 RepID=UPI0022258D95|nr:TonB-dependent receptor [Flavobacterium sp. N3904]
MKKSKLILSILFLFLSVFSFAQQGPPTKQKLKITGKVVEKNSNQPLEYATLTFKNPKNPKALSGGITNSKGEFEIEVFPGVYDITIEFISFKPTEIKQKNIQESGSLGLIQLEEDASQLNEVVIRTEKTTVEIKLDKKVYNVGKDLIVKGGTVSDVLDNIPSVSVDGEGIVSLRGNDNIRILIDGKPSNAINIAEALKQIPADAIDKVEVITNPSARYDAEGGGGILNIVLKKGKNQGLNGTFIGTIGHPENYGANLNLNYKTKDLNFFTTVGYNDRSNPGNGLTNTQYYNSDGSTKDYINETRDLQRTGKSLNSNFGFDWDITPTTSWTNSINYRKNDGKNTDTVLYDYYDANYLYLFNSSRTNNEKTQSDNFEYNSNFVQKFKKDGHKLSIDGSFSKNNDLNDGLIQDEALSSPIIAETQETYTDQSQTRNLIQADYVLPTGEGSQFEAGYKGDFSNLTNDYQVSDIENGIPVRNDTLSNTLEYIEKVNAVYAQYGFKKSKFSYLLGLRFENSNIDVNQLATSEFNNKKYNNFFPSVFITYEISDKSNLALNYSKRITRPRGRFMNPFINYSSKINIFSGNPNLDPSMTDKFDFGFLKIWDKLTFNTSMYFENTTDVFTFVRLETGLFEGTVPVILSTPINLADEQKLGFDFTLNYTPFKWWKINGNLNLFYVKTNGDYTYTDYTGKEVYENFDSNSTSWFARINSRVTLPYKIDWQTNMNYMGPQSNSQGKTLGVFGVNLGFSKDIFKDKASLALNVNDLFNSRIRKVDSYIPNVMSSYGEMQFRQRQINLSFTYRFNKQKTDKDKQPKKGQGEGESEFPG